MSNLQKSIKLNKQEIEEMMFRSSLNRQLNLAKVIRSQDSRLNVSTVEELEETEYKVELDNNSGKLTVEEEEEKNDKE